MFKKFNALLPDIKSSSWWLGTLLAMLIAGLAIVIADLPIMGHIGLGSMALAIVLGMIIGNTFFPIIAEKTAQGVDYAKNILLRVGIILYGFRISFQQIIGVGWHAIMVDILMVSLTFLLAMILGRYLFKLDKQTTMLVGAGSAICGAAAVIAAEPVVKAQPYKVTIAVATVVVFGTISMFLYPYLYPHLGLDAMQFGIYTGSTVHEVAQVVAVGKNIGEEVAQYAVIVKMIRVMLLVPFLILLSLYVSKTEQKNEAGLQRVVITVPWFALFFVIASCIYSLHIIPIQILSVLNSVSSFFLAMAMAALGLRTRIEAVRQAGIKPLLLAAILCLFLIFGGYIINILIIQ